MSSRILLVLPIAHTSVVQTVNFLVNIKILKVILFKVVSQENKTSISVKREFGGKITGLIKRYFLFIFFQDNYYKLCFKERGKTQFRNKFHFHNFGIVFYNLELGSFFPQTS